MIMCIQVELMVLLKHGELKQMVKLNHLNNFLIPVQHTNNYLNMLITFRNNNLEF
jgi:hypothetical protein